MTNQVDKSEAADARRMRWMLAGNGYFLEEEGLCGHSPCREDEQNEARRIIDEAMGGPTAALPTNQPTTPSSAA